MPESSHQSKQARVLSDSNNFYCEFRNPGTLYPANVWREPLQARSPNIHDVCACTVANPYGRRSESDVPVGAPVPRRPRLRTAQYTWRLRLYVCGTLMAIRVVTGRRGTGAPTARLSSNQRWPGIFRDRTPWYWRPYRTVVVQSTLARDFP